MEECFFDALLLVRRAVEQDRPTAEDMAGRLAAARERLDGRGRGARDGAPRVEAVYEIAARDDTPPEVRLKPGSVTTLRGQLGKALHQYNRASGGALLVGSADLLGSTSINAVAADMGEGYWNASDNPLSSHPLDWRHLRRRDGGDPLRAVVVGSPHRHRVVLRGLPRAPRPRRGPAPRDRRPGHRTRRALESHDSRLRARGPEDRGGRAHARRPPGAPAPAGELPAGHRRSPSRPGTRRRCGRSWPPRSGDGRRCSPPS